MSHRLEKKADTLLGISVASDIKDRKAMPRAVSGTKEEEK